MYNRDQLNEIYEKLADSVDISDSLFETAERFYTNMGEWIDKETPDYKITIYPQGSFALGTVIKPLDDSDDYDIDLVCQFDKNYGFNAEYLKKDIVKPLLIKYDKVTSIEEKRRCWQVLYEKTKNFHMDIIPSVNVERYIYITNKNEATNEYKYIGSNPKGYIDWFNQRKKIQHNLILESKYGNVKNFRAEVQKVNKFRIKTPLQKSIQILKRHRDIMFRDDKQNIAPISILITTISAQLYNNEDNIYDTLYAILSNAKDYVMANRRDNQYHIDNPSYTGPITENFAEKWNEHPERATAFFDWIDKANHDFLSSDIRLKNRIGLSISLKEAFGERAVERAFSAIAESQREQIKSHTQKVETATGIISPFGEIPIAPNHHYGK